MERADSLAPNPDRVLEAQLGVDPRRPVDAATGRVDLFDLLVSHASLSARSDGGRRSQSCKLVRFTPSTRHIIATG
jgi:hypothetical protein